MPTCDVNEQHWPCLSPSVGKSRLSSHLALDARPRLGAFVSPWWPHPARSPGPGPAPLCTPQWFCLVLFFRKLGEILRTHTHTATVGMWFSGTWGHHRDRLCPSPQLELAGLQEAGGHKRSSEGLGGCSWPWAGRGARLWALGSATNLAVHTSPLLILWCWVRSQSSRAL